MTPSRTQTSTMIPSRIHKPTNVAFLALGCITASRLTDRASAASEEPKAKNACSVSIQPCATVALRAPHQETATIATRIQLSTIHRRASDCRRSAGVFPPPASRKRPIVGRK